MFCVNYVILILQILIIAVSHYPVYTFIKTKFIHHTFIDKCKVPAAVNWMEYKPKTIPNIYTMMAVVALL